MSQKTQLSSYGLSAAILFIAGIGFFLLSIIALGILPGRQLNEHIARTTPEEQQPHTAAQERGRKIYAREGCAYCHTEQVRYLDRDVDRWGSPIMPWETRYEIPQLWGTRRIGPDLARESGVRSDDWQLVHLYNPRHVVPNSIMPGYPWLFNGSAEKPTQDAEDLVAYLQTLGRARRQQAGLDDEHATQHATREQSRLDLNPARPTSVSPGVVTHQAPAEGDVKRGEKVFAANCSACHGDSGRADSPGARALQPTPVDLTEYQFSEPGLISILHNGVAGSSMPAWRDLTDRELADVASYVHSLHEPSRVDEQEPDSRMLAEGAQLFANSCASCHGVDGEGDGPAAQVYKPRPFNFHNIQPNTQRILAVLEHGVPGTAMPDFPGFSKSQRRAVAAYVRSLYDGDDSGEQGGDNS